MSYAMNMTKFCGDRDFCFLCGGFSVSEISWKGSQAWQIQI